MTNVNKLIQRTRIGMGGDHPSRKKIKSFLSCESVVRSALGDAMASPQAATRRIMAAMGVCDLSPGEQDHLAGAMVKRWGDRAPIILILLAASAYFTGAKNPGATLARYHIPMSCAGRPRLKDGVDSVKEVLRRFSMMEEN